jgi:hypothetical protein
MYKDLHKNLTPRQDLNPGSSVLEADAMTTMPHRQGLFGYFFTVKLDSKWVGPGHTDGSGKIGLEQGFRIIHLLAF